MFSRRPARTAGHRPLLLLLLVLFSVTPHGIGSSSCGDIYNISFPFQLKSDTPASCGGDDTYTLSCENNRTILSLFAGKYHVRAIDYYNFVIRLADVGIQTTDICSSFPLHSLTPQNFTYGSGYGPWSAGTVLYLNCENQVHSPIYINRTGYCETGRHFAKGFYSYVMAGEVRVWDVADTCSVEMAAMSSSPAMSEGLGSDQLSFSDVNKMLEYGFDSSWQDIRTCGKCRKRASCFPAGDLNANATCSDFCRFEPSFLSKLWNNFQYNRNLIHLIIGAVFSARFLFAPCAYGFLIYKFRRRHLSTFDSIEGFLRSQINLVPIRYSYSDIKNMTKGFRDKLGEGGYGSVYKGKLRSGRFVAVKMLSKPKANGQDFINEVATIGRIHHVNVVQLIGYCAERSKRALVYDFMPNGSLEKYIFSPEGKFSLSCEQMYEISLGVARGIAYLHQGCDMQILHFDIKPHNILLDEDFTPKVSDFGLAKLYPTDESTVTLTAARGTLGYMAPELFYKNIGGVSYKADVYSFGMLLMEMAGKRRNWNSSVASSQIFFPSWVYDQFSEGRNVETRETTEEESEMVKKMMLVALWCIQMKPSDRPSMNKVVEMLEGNIELLDMPPKPFLYPSQMPAGIHGIDRESPNLSGAGVDAITFDISGR